MSQLLVHYRPFCIFDAKVRFFFELCKDFPIFFQKKFEVIHLFTYDINILEELEAEGLYYIL